MIRRLSRDINRPQRWGFSILEVIIAMAIAGAAITASVGLTAESLNSIRRTAEHSRQHAAAVNFFAHVMLWQADELDARLGEHPQGPWILQVKKINTRAYRIVLTDSADPANIILESVTSPVMVGAR